MRCTSTGTLYTISYKFACTPRPPWPTHRNSFYSSCLNLLYLHSGLLSSPTPLSLLSCGSFLLHPCHLSPTTYLHSLHCFLYLHDWITTPAWVLSPVHPASLWVQASCGPAHGTSLSSHLTIKFTHRFGCLFCTRLSLSSHLDVTLDTTCSLYTTARTTFRFYRLTLTRVVDNTYLYTTFTDCTSLLLVWV